MMSNPVGNCPSGRVQNTYSPAFNCGLMLRSNVANEVSPAMSVFPVHQFLLVILGHDAV
jgi:hypothetical protein